MTKSIVIFEDINKCIQLFDVFKEKSVMLSEAILIPPLNEKISSDEKELLNAKANILFKSQNFEDTRILNPKLDRKIRQKDMSRWLMPFGFIAGIAFSNMTNLSTFSFLGVNNIGESLIGGLLGLGSGYLGSIVSSDVIFSLIGGIKIASESITDFSLKTSNSWTHSAMSSNTTILFVNFQSSTVCVLFKLIK